jgi:hypothetical protein
MAIVMMINVWIIEGGICLLYDIAQIDDNDDDVFYWNRLQRGRYMHE